jgi:hypothetical protein
MTQKTMVSILKSALVDDGCTIDDSTGVINIVHCNAHTINAKLKWLNDHFAVYLVDVDGISSQAIMSIYTVSDMVKFIAFLQIAFELRARRRN